MNHNLHILLICIAFMAFSCTQEKASNEHPNIIVIFTDDLGYGDLACYGHPVIETPVLDQMAREGIRFTDFLAAASVCTPSRAALLTGRYPIRNTPFNFGPESKNGLPVDEITIADLLKEQGYETMAIGKWHLGHLPEYLPTANGFDDFYGLPYSNDMMLPYCPWLSETDTLFLYEGGQATKIINHDQDDLTKNYTHKAVDYIKANKERPFFLYFAHSMPHLPISTSKEFKGKSKAGLYGDVIQTIDWSVGQILQTLEETGIDDNTLVVFTSDNGPWQNLPDRMLQREVERWHAGSPGLLRGWKATSFEGGFRVPAIARWPGVIKAEQVNNQFATTMDLFVALAEIGGAELPKDRIIDGKNMLPLLKGENYESRETFFYIRNDKLHAVRKGKYKLRCRNDEGCELYDLHKDPSEKYDLAESEQILVNDLYAEMVKFSNETEAILDWVE